MFVVDNKISSVTIGETDVTQESLLELWIAVGFVDDDNCLVVDRFALSVGMIGPRGTSVTRGTNTPSHTDGSHCAVHYSFFGDICIAFADGTMVGDAL